jgi:hypothetical protein
MFGTLTWKLVEEIQMVETLVGWLAAGNPNVDGAMNTVTIAFDNGDSNGCSFGPRSASVELRKADNMINFDGQLSCRPHADYA